jgi:hypothetical protein
VPVDGLASVLVTEYHEGVKPALFIVRAFYGARRSLAKRPLLWVVRLCVAHVLPGARRPDACRSMGWLRFWSPSITRARSQLFMVISKVLCRSYNPPLYVVRVSFESCRPDACRSMDLVVKEVRSFIKGKGREGKCNALLLRVGRIYEYHRRVRISSGCLGYAVTVNAYLFRYLVRMEAV